MASLDALIKILGGTSVADSGLSIGGVLRDARAIGGVVQGEQAAGRASELSDSARRAVDQQTRIAGNLDRLSAPLAEEGAGFLKDVLQGERPPLLGRITNPQSGMLAEQFKNARASIGSRVNRGGARQRLLSNSFTDEAIARTGIESNAANNALTQALGIGFRVPINSANIFGSTARSNLTLAQQQSQRAASAGQSINQLFELFGS